MNATTSQLPRRNNRAVRGFALLDAVVGLAVCVIALGAFYAAAGQSVRLVRDARERALASQLLEQRLEEWRTRPAWTDMVGPAGLSAILASAPPGGGQLPMVSERYAVGPNPGATDAYTVTRAISGAVAVQGTPMPVAQTSLRVTATVQWAGPGDGRRSRSVSTILTKGGL